MLKRLGRSLVLMHEITPDLYLADIEQAGDPAEYKQNGIDAVIQVTHTDPLDGYPEDVDLYSYPMLDGPRNDQETMVEAVSKAVELLAEEETVAVHCSAGESRSVGVCMAAVAVSQEVEFDQGWEAVESVKPVRAHPAVVDNARTAFQDLVD